MSKDVIYFNRAEIADLKYKQFKIPFTLSDESEVTLIASNDGYTAVWDRINNVIVENNYILEDIDWTEKYIFIKLK